MRSEPVAQTLPSGPATATQPDATNDPGKTSGQNLPWVAPGSGQTVGYSRVSTGEQSLDRQRSELTAAGCTRIFEDLGFSGSKMQRPGIDAALGYIRAGDCLVVTELSRLGRDTLGVLTLSDELATAGVSLRILNMALDTGTPAGKALLAIAAAFAQMERDLVRERVLSGLAEARRQGRTGGRPPALSAEQRQLASRLVAEGQSPTQVGRVLGCSERTIRRLTAATN